MNVVTTLHNETATFDTRQQAETGALTERGLRLISLPTASAQRLGVRNLAMAAASGDRLATCVCGMCLLDGVGYARDEERGIALLERAVEMGSHLAEDRLAHHYIMNWFPCLDLEILNLEPGEVLAWNLESAWDVWRHARGSLLRHGITAEDYRVLCDVFDTILWRGEVVDADELAACQDMADVGNAHAIFLLGMAYIEGRAGVSSKDVGARLIALARDRGDADACRWCSEH